MFNLKSFIKDATAPYLRYRPTDSILRYLGIARTAYFLSTIGLLVFVLRSQEREQKQEDKERQLRIEMGFPVIVDHSDAHKNLRMKGVESGYVYEYRPERGMIKVPYNRKEYLEKLETEALERSKDAQRKLIAEGKELPRGAIKLI